MSRYGTAGSKSLREEAWVVGLGIMLEGVDLHRDHPRDQQVRTIAGTRVLDLPVWEHVPR